MSYLKGYNGYSRVAYDSWKTSYPPEWDAPLYTESQAKETLDCTANTIGCDNSDLEWEGDNRNEAWLVLTLPNGRRIDIDPEDAADVIRAYNRRDTYLEIESAMVSATDPTLAKSGSFIGMAHKVGIVAHLVKARIEANLSSLGRADATNAVY